MEEVIIDVSQHPSGCLEIMERPFQAFWIRTILRDRDGGMSGRDLKDNRSLLEGERGLSGELGGECSTHLRPEKHGESAESANEHHGEYATPS